MGVTLVDTPGADSINARHTGVAFDYIRNAIPFYLLPIIIMHSQKQIVSF
ncbi:hypothetical protein [Ureibacillus acetophenoni]